MKLYHSTDPQPTGQTEKLHVYNALDCCITLEVFEEIVSQLDEVTSKVYSFERALQGPILDMQCQGVRIDKRRVALVKERLQKQIVFLEEALNELCTEGLGVLPLNPRSPKQVKEFLYGTLGLPPVKKRTASGRYEATADRKALEKLKGYFHAEPFISHILAIRDAGKKLGVLNTGVDPDGRMRTSFNIAGTDTGRLSSYESALGSGTNLQNITAELREIFVADEGKKFAYIDLEQAESRAVGSIVWNLFQDSRYLDFCESGDLHTGVCMMTWRDKPWFDNRPILQQLTDREAYKHNRAIADEQFYRVDSFRQGAKKLGHATNYFGKPPQISLQTKIPVELVRDFQRQYFTAFPGIEEWHKWTRVKLIKDGWITSLMGRRRHFFGRRYDDNTLRAAIAYDPQGSVGDIMNTGLLNLWRANIPGLQILLQVHDALLIQYPEEQEEEIVSRAQQLLEVEVPLMNGRSLKIPTEAMTGWNWGYARNDKGQVVNPDGLEKYKGADTRTRSTAMSILDQQFH